MNDATASHTQASQAPAAPPAAPKNRAVALRDELLAFGAQVQLVLPPHVGVDKFMRTAVTAVMGNAMLLDCNRKALFKSCLDLAQRGLMPDGIEGAIVPYKKGNTVSCSAQPMVAGLLKLVRQSGQLRSIVARCVYSGETFEHYVDETGEHFKHVPSYAKRAANADPMLVYAMAQTGGEAGEGLYLEVMPWDEVLDFKRRSKAQSPDAPWAQWTERMALVRVVKRLCKRLPMSSDVIDFINRTDKDEAAIHGMPGSAPDAAAALNSMFTAEPEGADAQGE